MRWPWSRGETASTPRARTGRAAERAAARFLRRRGCRILARNVRFPEGEIDLVALERRTRTLCFVEVRSRAAAPGEGPSIPPEATVTGAKQRRIVRAARAYLKTHGASFERPIRFDVIAVRFDGTDRRRPAIKHLPGAFDAGGR